MVDSTGKLYDPCIIQQGDGLKYNQDASVGRYVLGGLNVWKQMNNTMTSDIMVDFIYKYIDPLFNRDDRKLLVMNSFSDHLTSNVKDALGVFDTCGSNPSEPDVCFIHCMLHADADAICLSRVSCGITKEHRKQLNDSR